MWTIAKIEEADYGCEKRLPGEPRMLLITLESEDGAAIQFEAAENWIEIQGLDEGDEWPEDLEDEEFDDQMAAEQAEWMEDIIALFRSWKYESDNYQCAHNRCAHTTRSVNYVSGRIE
jgi:hypothetical protein